MTKHNTSEAKKGKSQAHTSWKKRRADRSERSAKIIFFSSKTLCKAYLSNQFNSEIGLG